MRGVTDPIRVAGVTKRYASVTALDGVDLCVDPGTFHCLVGPNGSGKTTLLRVVLRLTRPTSGRVDVPDADLGVAFQRPSHYDQLTVAENVEVFRALADADSDWSETVVERLGLDAVRGRVAGELSGGFSRKLDVALALLKEPDFLLLDEPLADLDDVTKRRLVSFLADYRDRGGAVLVSTHNLDTFEAAVDHLTVMHRGRVLLDAPAAELSNENLHEYYVERVLAADAAAEGERPAADGDGA